MRPLDPRVLPHLRPARVPLAIVLLGNVLNGMLVVAQAFAAAWLVSALIAGEGDWGRAAALLAATLVARAAVGWIADFAAASAARRVGDGLRTALLRRVVAEPAAQRRVGEVGALATRGVAAVEPYLTRYLPALVTGAVLPLLTLAALASQDLIAAGIVLATLPLVPLFAALVGVETRRRAEHQWRLMAALSGHFVDVVRGLPTLISFGRAHAQTERIRSITERYRKANREVLRLAFASSAVLELVATISVALVAVVVGLRLAQGGLDLRTALTVLLLAPEAYWPLRRVGAEFHAAAEGTATFEAINEFIEVDGAQPARVDASDSTAPLRGPLQLERLTLTWPGQARPAVRHLSATLPETGLTVVTGPSGCGKSTLLAAVLGDLDPSSGRIMVGERDLAEVERDAWRAQIAYFPQRPWLADASVADNVRVGRPEASEEEVAAVLAAVGLDLDPSLRLAEDGAGLSAGQRARVALARVLLADRPFVLLDEPVAHLDAATEELIVRVVQDLAKTRCVVAVAHRPALVAAAATVLRLSAPAAVELQQPAMGVGAPAQTAARIDDSDAAAGHKPRVAWWAVRLWGVLAAGSGVALTATAGWLIATAAEQPPVLTLMVAIVGVRTFGLARPVLHWLERIAGHDLALHELAQRRSAIYSAVIPLVPGRLGTPRGRRRGDLLASLVDDVDALLDQRLRVRGPVWTWLGTVALTGLLAAWLLPAAGAVIWVCALGGGALAWATGRGAGRVSRAEISARAAMSRRVLEVIDDAPTLAHWQATEQALGRVAEESDRRGRAGTTRAAWVATARLWPSLAVAAAVAGVAAVAADALATDRVSGPVAALLVLVPLALFDVLTPIADAGALSHHTRAAQERLTSLSRMTPAVSDPVASLPVDGTDIVVRGVAARWPEADRVSLAPVDLDLPRGRAIAVVGPSGSGKSTLVALLARHLLPEQGRYQLGGREITGLRGEDVRAAVGVLDDDPYLFGSTVAENVRLARPEASDAEVADALIRARLGEWVSSLPQGLTTVIGDGAASVSGGERARIGLARLLLADRPVLVLDEPTAHLDTPTARAVADDLLAERGNRSIVWVSHDGIGLDAVDEVVELGYRGGDRQQLDRTEVLV